MEVQRNEENIKLQNKQKEQSYIKRLNNMQYQHERDEMYFFFTKNTCIKTKKK